MNAGGIVRADDDPLAGRPAIEIWPNGAPDALGEEPADRPTLTLFLPEADKANGSAVVVCPGGGYGHLATGHEGRAIGDWLNSFGTAALVLKYRIAPRYHHPAPMQDVQRALRTARGRADEWRIDPQRVGVLGFSAGGHLASTAATHFDAGDPDADDPVERVSCRPDFAVLCYPVVTMTDPYTHRGSRQNLLGEAPSDELIEFYSNERRVTADTPPTFLFHTDEDAAVPAENSVMFYLALRKAGIPAEMHVYRPGRHGVGLAPGDPVLSTWAGHCEDWLQGHGFLGK
ncbi:MAG: alpha/beta hydrolase [Planctomycetales bacterium]|nr:alpha/beta hydrolase [Planctomycetales bacterium]